MSDPLERVLRDGLDGIRPGERGVERSVAAARQAATRGRQRRRRLRWQVGVIAGVAIAAGSVLAVAVVKPFGDGATLPVAPSGAHGQSDANVLKSAPWLYQPRGGRLVQTAPAVASVSFPAGTSYKAAIRAVVITVIERGALPANARIVKPLPREKVWSVRSSRPTLSLMAPFGFSIPEGRIRTPSFSISGAVPPARASQIVRALRGGTPAGRGAARGVRIDVPRLTKCQIVTRAAVRSQCRLERPPRG